MIVSICIGSSCHLKGSNDIVELMKKAVELNGLQTEVTLAGSFCMGKCSHSGVKVQVDEEIFTGVTRESFKEFFNNNILKPILAERGAKTDNGRSVKTKKIEL